MIAAGLRARRLHLITQTEVEGEVAGDVPIVLEVSGIIVPAVIAGHRLRCIDVGADIAQDEGAKRASSAERAIDGGGKEAVPATGEAAEIVLVGLDATDVAAKLEEMRAMRPGEVVAEEEVLVDLNGSVADTVPDT